MPQLALRLLICLALWFPLGLQAHESELEYKVKAGYIYNFTKFITWPKDDLTSFNLCILGNDPFGAIIDAIEKKTAFARPIRLFRIPTASFLNGDPAFPACHIVFLGANENHRSVIDKIKAAPAKIKALSVGDYENFAADGGMIGFVNKNGNIKLQVNLDSVKHSGLKISAKLMEIADLVRNEP